MFRLPRVLFSLIALGLIVAFRPLTDDVTRDGRTLEFVDRNGFALGTLLGRDERHAVAVPLQRMSQHFATAILAAEDQRFFLHGAVDPLAAARAFAATMLHRRPLGGASTISMQLARLVAPIPPSWFGKFEEAWLAQRLENGLSKERILEAYCNRVPMGSNVYGVEAAARAYFGIDAAALDLAQAALLAALPNDPVRLDPYRHWAQLKQRQHYVLARMRAEGAVSAGEAARAADEQIALRPPSGGIAAAPHFLFWLAPQIAANRSRIVTTIDLPLQRFVEAQVADVVRALAAHAVRDAAAIVLENRTGQILAYAGSPDYFATDRLGSNDGVQALRQPGSTLKPFLYELALERRAIRPTTILADVPTAYDIGNAQLYAPNDYSSRFMGPVRVRIALADSLNVPAVRVLSTVGVAPFLARLRALGFSDLAKPASYYGLGLTLGAGEVSLLQLARAYATLARGGVAAPLVSTLDGSVPEAREGTADAAASLGDAPSWALVTDMLADAHARAAAFGVDSVLNPPFPAAAKTGTSSDFRDTWTVGFTRDYTVAVWVGNFDGSPMRHVSGVTGAGPLWNRIVLHLHERREPAPFAPPRGYAWRTICAETGALAGRGCHARVGEYLDSDDLAAERVTRASPLQSHVYDAWLASQPVRRDGALRILFPRDGDRFVYERGRSPERIALVFTGAPPSHVTINGSPLRADAGDYLWTLAPGSYELRAQSGRAEARVRFTVDLPAAPPHRGFSLAVPHGPIKARLL